jgi:hypothetical protein
MAPAAIISLGEKRVLSPEESEALTSASVTFQDSQLDIVSSTYGDQLVDPCIQRDRYGECWDWLNSSADGRSAMINIRNDQAGTGEPQHSLYDLPVSLWSFDRLASDYPDGVFPISNPETSKQADALRWLASAMLDLAKRPAVSSEIATLYYDTNQGSYDSTLGHIKLRIIRQNQNVVSSRYTEIIPTPKFSELGREAITRAEKQVNQDRWHRDVHSGQPIKESSLEAFLKDSVSHQSDRKTYKYFRQFIARHALVLAVESAAVRSQYKVDSLPLSEQRSAA